MKTKIFLTIVFFLFFLNIKTVFSAVGSSCKSNGCGTSTGCSSGEFCGHLGEPFPCGTTVYDGECFSKSSNENDAVGLNKSGNNSCPEGEYWDESNETCAKNNTTTGEPSTYCPNGGYWDESNETCTGSPEPGEENCPAGSFEDEYGRCISKSTGEQINPGGGGGGGWGGGSSTPNGTSSNPNLDCSSGVCFPINTNLPDPSGGIPKIVENILYWILGVFGMLAIIAFVISGIQYIFSAGSEKMMDNAKRSMIASIIGVAISLSGLLIIYAIDKAFRATSMF